MSKFKAQQKWPVASGYPDID